MISLPMYLLGLTASFVALDVAGKIDWTWWQVTMPLLLALGAGLLGVVVRAFSSPTKK